MYSSGVTHQRVPVRFCSVSNTSPADGNLLFVYHIGAELGVAAAGTTRATSPDGLNGGDVISSARSQAENLVRVLALG